MHLLVQHVQCFCAQAFEYIILMLHVTCISEHYLLAQCNLHAVLLSLLYEATCIIIFYFEVGVHGLCTTR